MKKKLKIITQISSKKSVLKKNDVYPGYPHYPSNAYSGETVHPIPG